VGGFGVAKVPSVGVTDGGNQTMVGVGIEVPVGEIAIGVAFSASSTEQELKRNVIMRAPARSNLRMGWRFLCRLDLDTVS
jgi:hypothetical protein